MEGGVGIELAARLHLRRLLLVILLRLVLQFESKR